MKINKHILLVILVLTASLLLSSCSGSVDIASSWPGLAVYEDTAYIANNQHVYAVSLSNGNEKWRFPGEANNQVSFFAPPVMTPDGQLLVGGYNNILYSLNPGNGQEIWSFKGANDRYVDSPFIYNEKIYAPTAGNNLYALDLKGNLLWTFSSKGAQWAQPTAIPDCGCIYLPSMDHFLYAIDANNGTLLWKTERLDGSIVGTPAYDESGMLYFGTFSSDLVKVNSKTHQSTTLVTTDGWIWGGPKLQNGILYFGNLSGSFYAMEAGNGKILWQEKPDKAIIGSPLVTDSHVYWGAESGQFYAYSLDGVLEWSTTLEGSIFTTAQISDNKIIVAPYKTEKLLTALDLNGATVWSFTPAK